MTALAGQSFFKETSPGHVPRSILDGNLSTTNQRSSSIEAQDKGQANQIFDIFSIGNPYNGCIYVYIYISLLLGL